jgi:hypothetical protein
MKSLIDGSANVSKKESAILVVNQRQRADAEKVSRSDGFHARDGAPLLRMNARDRTVLPLELLPHLGLLVDQVIDLLVPVDVVDVLERHARRPRHGSDQFSNGNTTSAEPHCDL